MNQIQTFNFHSNEVRTATDQNGDIYFCLADVANVLELGNANASRFQLDEKGVHKMYTPMRTISMNQLIPLHPQTIDGNAIETVSARELHSFV